MVEQHCRHPPRQVAAQPAGADPGRHQDQPVGAAMERPQHGGDPRQAGHLVDGDAAGNLPVRALGCGN